MPELAQSYPLSAKAARTKDSPISWLLKMVADDPEILSLAAGLVDQTQLPHDLVQEAISKVFAEEKAAKEALQYGTTGGNPRLRQLIAERLEAQGVPNVDPDNIIVSNGGQQSLFNVTEVMADPGDIVLVEDPTYFVYMDVLTSAGARVMGVTTDEEGMVPAALRERFAQIRSEGQRERLKILYLMSYYTNPKGANMSAERRREIWDIFQEELGHGAPFLLLEDACYRDLCLDGEPGPFMKSFDGENLYCAVSGTFSKAFAPGVRLGWSYLPEEIRKACSLQKGNQDFGSSNLNQNIVRHLMETGAYDEAAARFRSIYRTKRDGLIAALKEFWPADTQILEPLGGLYVWVQLPGIDTDPGSEFFKAAMDAKVLYVPGKFCYCEETQQERPTNAMRLSYGYASVDEMREAVARLGRIAERLATS